ncbi:cytochrome c biogenesis factor, partial [Rhizobium sp. BK456]|nr:cytochrome c biogenesis factor [Rhizobium sp. BK456]
GALVMAVGGLVSLSDRRLRVGAPRRKAKAAKPVEPAMEPAE